MCVWWGVNGRADIQILFRFSPFFKVTQRGLCWIFAAWNVLIWRFFFDLIGTHVFFFLSSVLHNSQAINYVLFNLIFIEQTIFSYYYNIPQVEEFFSCFLFALSLIINCMVIIVCIIIQFANAILHSRIYTLTQSIHKTHWDEIISEGAYFISYPLHNSFINFILRMLDNWRIILWKRSWIKK